MPIVFIGFGDQFYFLVFIDIYKKFRGATPPNKKKKSQRIIPSLNIIVGAPAIRIVPVASMGSTTSTRDSSGNLSGNLKKDRPHKEYTKVEMTKREAKGGKWNKSKRINKNGN